jgi:hypothetical protein
MPGRADGTPTLPTAHRSLRRRNGAAPHAGAACAAAAVRSVLRTVSRKPSAPARAKILPMELDGRTCVFVPSAAAIHNTRTAGTEAEAPHRVVV